MIIIYNSYQIAVSSIKRQFVLNMFILCSTNQTTMAKVPSEALLLFVVTLLTVNGELFVPSPFINYHQLTTMYHSQNGSPNLRGSTPKVYSSSIFSRIITIPNEQENVKHPTNGLVSLYVALNERGPNNGGLIDDGTNVQTNQATNNQKITISHGYVYNTY